MGQIEEGRGWFLGSYCTSFGETGVLDWSNNKRWDKIDRSKVGLIRFGDRFILDDEEVGVVKDALEISDWNSYGNNCL